MGFAVRCLTADLLTKALFPEAAVHSLTIWGRLNADRISGTYSNVSWANFANIQRINLFLDNIDNIAENFSEPKKSEVKAKTDLIKGEALFLRAYIYTNMCRTFGGVPINE